MTLSTHSLLSPSTTDISAKDVQQMSTRLDIDAHASSSHRYPSGAGKHLLQEASSTCRIIRGPTRFLKDPRHENNYSTLIQQQEVPCGH